MKLSARQIAGYAKSLNIDDIRFARADGDVSLLRGGRVPLSSYLGTAKCMIALFKSYLPASGASAGKMAVSPYYIASNAAYHAANELVRHINGSGGHAVRVSDISVREAALRTGGFIGGNGFYYHDDLGSFVCIQIILTDAAEPIEYRKGESRCLHCGRCAKACPSGAVPDIGSCLRAHINGLVPERLRADVYQLFGCERCQSACPLNSPERSAPVEADLTELLRGTATERLKALVGANTARRTRLQSQAALYAGAVRARESAGILDELSRSSAEPVKTHAAWALERIKNDKA